MSISQRRRSSAVRITVDLHANEIKKEMNLERVAKAIAEEGDMLTTDQQNLLWQRFTPEEDRKTQLLEFVCQKGEDGMEQFLRALRASGHSDLANKLESYVESQ